MNTSKVLKGMATATRKKLQDRNKLTRYEGKLYTDAEFVELFFTSKEYLKVERVKTPTMKRAKHRLYMQDEKYGEVFVDINKNQYDYAIAIECYQEDEAEAEDMKNNPDKYVSESMLMELFTLNGKLTGVKCK